MKRFILVLLGAICIFSFSFAMIGMNAFADSSARGYGMSVADWNDPFGQAREQGDGIEIGADASLKLPLDSRYFKTDLKFTTVPTVDFWYVISLSHNASFDGWSALTSTPTQEAMIIWLKPSGSKMAVDLFSWTEIDGTMTKTDIAIGDNPVGIDMGADFSLEMKLVGSSYEITFSNGMESHTYTAQTNAGLAVLSQSDISNSYGETFLNVTCYASDGDTKYLKFSNLKTYVGLFEQNNWESSGITFGDKSITVINNAKYIKPISASSKYIKLHLNIDMIISNVDAWVALGFTKTSDYPQNSVEGLKLLMRNQGGKLFIQGTTGNIGQGIGKTYDNISALGDFVLEILEEEGDIKILVNRIDITEVSGLSELKFSDFIDANGKFYFSIGSYVAGTSANQLTLKMLSTDLRDKEMIYMVITGVPESGVVGKEITLPAATVVQVDGEEVSAVITVKDAQGQSVTVTDRKFTPAAKGTYTVTYTATDSKENTAVKEYSIIVSDYADSLLPESIKDINNYSAPWGGLSSMASGMRIFAHSYYKLPIKVVNDTVRVTIDILGLWDGNDTETAIDSWITIGFVKEPAISGPGSFTADGLYVRFNNRSGKLVTSIHGFSVLGEELVCVEDAFADKDALGEVVIELQKSGEDGIALLVNNKKCTKPGLSNIYYSDIVNDDGCLYLAFSAYDNDEADAKKSNLESRCFTLKAIDNEKTTVAVDTEKPVISVTGMPTTGKVNEKIVLPIASVTDNVDSGLSATITVKDPDNIAVSVVNRSFTPTKAGTYTVTFTAVDSAGNQADETFTITVTASKDVKKTGCKSSIAEEFGIGSLLAVLSVAVVVFIRKKHIN